MTLQREILGDVVRIFASRAYVQALGLARSIVLAKLLGPLAFGYLRIVELIIEYHRFTTLGTQDAALREISYLKGGGKEDEAKLVENTAFTHIFTIPLLASIGIFAASWFYKDDDTIFAALQITGIISMLIMISTFYQIVLTTRKKFGAIAKAMAIHGTIFLVTSIALAYFFGFVGLLWAYVIGQTVLTLLYAAHHKEKFVLAYRLTRVGSLIKLGLPLMLAALAAMLLISADRIIIATILGVKYLGYYGIAVIVSVFVFQIPAQVYGILYPRLNERFGESGDGKSIATLAVIPARVLSVVMAGILVGTIWIVGDLVTIYMREYTASIIPLQVLVLGSSFVGVPVLRTLRKQNLLLGATVCAALLNGGASLYAATAGYGLVGIACASTTALLSLKLFETSLSLHYLGYAVGGVLREIGRLSAPYLYVLAARTAWLTIRHEVDLVDHLPMAEVIGLTVAMLPVGYLFVREVRLAGLLGRDSAWQ